MVLFQHDLRWGYVRVDMGSVGCLGAGKERDWSSKLFQGKWYGNSFERWKEREEKGRIEYVGMSIIDRLGSCWVGTTVGGRL